MTLKIFGNDFAYEYEYFDVDHSISDAKPNHPILSSVRLFI